MAQRRHLKRTHRRRAPFPSHRRPLRFEPLEDRRLLATFTVDTVLDVVDANDGVMSLHEAIYLAEVNSGADTIDFAPALFAGGPATIQLSAANFVPINSPLTIRGPGSSLLTLDGNRATAFFGIPAFTGNFEFSAMRFINASGFAIGSNSQGQMTIRDLIVDGTNISTSTGYAISTRGALAISTSAIRNTNGGGVSSTGPIDITDSTFEANTANNQGAVTGSTVYVANSSFIGNSVNQRDGGAINAFGNVTIESCTFTNNTSAGAGGAVYSTGGDVVVENSTFTGNRTLNTSGNQPGGAVGGAAINARDVTVHNCTFNTNISNFNGASSNGLGGTVRARGDLHVSESTFSGNLVKGSGGRGAALYGAMAVTIDSCTFSGNTAGSSGGAVHARGLMTVSDSTFSGNTAASQAIGGGGAVYAFAGGTVDRCLITGNEILNGGDGGGIAARANLSITDCTITDNHTIAPTGSSGPGGGISAGWNYGSTTLTITRSTISGNSTKGRSSNGGGISANRLNLFDSVVNDNSSDGNLSTGGGVFAVYATIVNSTISGNRALLIPPFQFGDRNFGGGVRIFNSATIRNSTITGNSAPEGGGVFFSTATASDITNSIIAGNTAPSAPDLQLGQSGTGQLRFNLIGDTAGMSAAVVTALVATGNLVNVSPQLGPLSNNGGPTMTHALLPGSPAIDAGDPAALAGAGGVPEFDQRGLPWGRVADGNLDGGLRIDMGAFERQPNPLAGDYNFNGVVDAADMIVWRKTLGSSNDLRADGDFDGDVDQDDYDVWRSSFGNVRTPPVMSAHVTSSQPPVEDPPWRALPAVGVALRTEVLATVATDPVARRQAVSSGLSGTAASATVAPRHDEALLAWSSVNDDRPVVRDRGDSDDAIQSSDDDSQAAFEGALDLALADWEVEL